MTTVNGHKVDHHIKASQLIEWLQEIIAEYGDADIVLSSDAEGNNHSPLAGIDVGRYMPDCTWSGEYGCLEYIAKYPDDYDHLDEESSVLAICLGPVN